MSVSDAPHVSVLIPVYNGEALIASAIRSVLAQTWTTFDLTIVNNCSTDRTRAIAESFVRADPRVRIHDNDKFLNVIDNHSKAFSLVSAPAKYAKILGADDWFFPHCLEELVRVAEAYPSIGMVTSYVLSGSRVSFDGLPYPSTFVSGRELCRLRLLKGIKVFGGPSASLIRASIVRDKQPFYNPLNYHGDNEAYLDLLREHDFGFVHQILSYNFKGEASRTTSYLERVNAYPAADVHEIVKFGPIYLSEPEFAARLREVTRAYYQFLAARAFTFPGREFWHYHFVHVKRLGYSISYVRLVLYMAARIADVVFNPKRTLEGIIRRLRR